VDLPKAGGGLQQALIVSTKRGEIFLLDRVTGEPITPVTQHPAPQNGAVPEERLAPTQPFSDAMPSLRGPVLTEQAMWGVTPLDQIDVEHGVALGSVTAGLAAQFGTPYALAPLAIGNPSAGGTLVTRGGITFLAGTLDRHIRAVETVTGKLLWTARLPAGGQATPMTYLTPDGRQFVVTGAGGHHLMGTKPGDYIIAYGLPKAGQ
jgi:glucose dehydrogenase